MLFWRMPSFGDWLQASWEDFRRRWGALLSVLGAGGAAMIVGGFLPLLVAGLIGAAGFAPWWVALGAGLVAAFSVAFWLSTWAQAAVSRAAMIEESAGESLTRAWGQTSAFAWVFTLLWLAVGGASFFLLIPGLLLFILFFFAPFIVLTEEAEGLRALEVSWGRVRPHFATVSSRLAVAMVLTAAPGYIPYVGWILSMFWAPFGVVAFARIAKDLRSAVPAPAPVRGLSAAVTVLSTFCLGAVLFLSIAASRAARAALLSLNEPGGLASRVRPETLQALTAAYSGQADDAAKKKALLQLFEEIKTPPPAAP
jgi:hypothetical protein